ncbi:MAG: NUDIX domain-containing protein [Bacteroidales bacterium]|nr:NUDIX domain-containing protein [Bacteroidales bacterium]
MYKVFYNDRTVFFTDDKQNYTENSENKIHYFRNKKLLKSALNTFINNSEINNLYVIAKNTERVFRKYIRIYKLIEAAGGLVITNDKKALFIYRRGKWDLPKGKLEKNENPETGAIREVEEECGLSNLLITKLLEITYHTYTLKGKSILKRTYWYEMYHDGNQEPVPQTEEEITDAVWLGSDNYYKILHNTYPSIIQVLKKGNLIK